MMPLTGDKDIDEKMRLILFKDKDGIRLDRYCGFEEYREQNN